MSSTDNQRALDEKKVRDELKVCLDRQKAREKSAMQAPPSMPGGTPGSGSGES